MEEKIVQQLMSVLLSEFRTKDRLEVRHKLGNSLHEPCCLDSGLFNAFKDEENPGLPFIGVIRILVSNVLNKLIVLLLIMGNVSAEIQNRKIQPAGKDKKEYTDYSSRSSVAVIERMDALKLMMNYRQFDEGVKLGNIVIITRVRDKEIDKKDESAAKNSCRFFW